MQSQPKEGNSSAPKKLISAFTRPPVNKNSTDVIIILFLSPRSTVVFPNASMVLSEVALFLPFVVVVEIFKKKKGTAYIQENVLRGTTRSQYGCHK